MGFDTVPCVRADDLTQKQIKAYRILDNKLNELASWDFEMLGEELETFEFDFEPFALKFQLSIGKIFLMLKKMETTSRRPNPKRLFRIIPRQALYPLLIHQANFLLKIRENQPNPLLMNL